MASQWFPSGEDNQPGWRLDIVSLLAVIGESSMEEHSQALTASWFVVLPRIIPAPQALLKPSRKTRLPSINASVFGIYNGTGFDQLNYFPNLIHPVEDLPAFAFEVWEIKRNAKNKKAVTFYKANQELPPDVDCKTLAVRQNSILNRISSNRDPTHPPPHVYPRLYSPLNLLNVFSFVLTLGLFVWAILIKDGVACLALFTISFATSVVGLASKWTPNLMRRNSKLQDLPPGDVVIRTRKGAFIVVKCDENISRELYTGTEECEYVVGTKVYRGLVGLGTVLVMLAVVLLGNCNWAMQCAIGLSYLFLNGLFWGASLISKDKTWDLSLYEFKNITPKDACRADEPLQPAFPKPVDPDGVASFTRTLWYAIREIRSVNWVYTTGAAPKTQHWSRWLTEAQSNINAGNRDWKAVAAKDRIFADSDDLEELGDWDGEKVLVSRPGRQNAPARIIPPQETRDK